MLFNSPLYGAFLIAVYLLFWILRDRRLLRASFLVLASYGFYFYGTLDTSREQDTPLGPWGWSVLCLGIIFVGSSLDYWIGKALGRATQPRTRKALLLLSITYYLGVLATFKYWNFAADSLTALIGWAGIRVKPTHLRLVLPFGISFFTFETMSYTIDVYRRQIEPCRRYLDYLLFVSFFPHLVAGPIVRPHTMLPQFEQRPALDYDVQARGLFRIAVGLFKKIAIGDFLAVNLVKRVFDNPERYSSLELLVAVYAYAIEIYCDFSGYTDVALGSAQLFGYELPENFRAPYLAKNLQDFWHRWHISLSSWLRDYLYIPLGGSRGSEARTYRNLFLTMLLGGLWHGAAWTYVVWGALHGIGLGVTRYFQRRRDTSPAPASASRQVIHLVLTFHFVCLCWIFFRAPTLQHAWLYLRRLSVLTHSTSNLSVQVLLMLGLGFLTHAMPLDWHHRLRERFVIAPAYVQGIVLAAFAYTLHFVAGAKAEPFVYGQF